jgi:hypothetical protein
MLFIYYYLNGLNNINFGEIVYLFFHLFILTIIMGDGDWGLGIGDWAQSPIPNPQSPIPNPQSPFLLIFFEIIYYFYKYFYFKNNYT